MHRNGRPESEELELRLEFTDSEVAAISIIGTIDGATAPQLKRRIEEAIDAGRRRIVIDLSSTDFLDSTSLAVVVAAWFRLRHDGRLVIVEPRDGAGRTLRTAGIDAAIELFADREAAVSAARRGDGEPAAA
jgi:anti-sigma B factor antagonist